MRETLEKKKGSGLGAAFDIGTTTLVCALVDLENRAVLSTESLPNPQSRWGRDVIARMEAAVGPDGALGELTAAIREALSGLLASVAGGRIGEVTALAAAGNSVMEHLFLGISPEPLSKVPYKPAFREAVTIAASDAGLLAGCGMYLFPLIGGFVGGDAVAAALSLGMPGKGRPVLAIDIGTNSEILLSSGGVLYATSAAAGPAFEGGEVEYGMTAALGAIQGVTIEDDSVSLDVIGGVAPKGICGSGLIEAVSMLLKAGVIDRTGRIRDKDEVASNLSSRIKESPAGNSFTLYRGPKKEISLAQSDIRALQTAKSATRAGISMLLMKAGIRPEEVETVYIAGAFGSHLKEDGLRTIGLLDDAWTDIRTVGDAALEGAVMALYDNGKKEAGTIAAEARYVPLSGSAHFERDFLRNMNF
ncbi:MAG: DUF4445 domain-containing protein [Deltaproteobacteria bacterium]|nr:DUF4445 domain-containing protein [Deltaproteobacteria bacterium]